MAIIAQEHGQLIPPETRQAIVRRVVDEFDPEKVILFGSYASGSPTPDSDLDLLVIMQTDLPAHKRAVPLRLLFTPSPCSIDLLVFTPAEVEKWNGTANHIITEALSRGRVVYER